MSFTSEQIERYSRHILLQEVGVEGQEKISRGKVLIIGIGGLGSPALLYLSAAGVGTIGIMDGDKVGLSNLQRQIAHFTPDLEKSKVISAKEKIEKINPDVQVKLHHSFFSTDNALEVIKDYDFIIDGTDNFSAKFLISDACVLAEKPFSHGGVLRFEGQTFTYIPGTTCYRCIFHSPPPVNAVPNCAQSGILGVIAGMLGTMQAAEALKFLTGTGELLTNRLLMFNAKSMNFRTIRINKNKECPICGERSKIKELDRNWTSRL